MMDRALLKVGELCRQLSHHGRRLGRRIAAAAAERFRDRLPDSGHGVGLYDYQVLLANELDARYARLVAWHDRRFRDQETLGELRRLRDTAADELRQRLLGVSDALEGSYPPGGLAQVFLRRFRPLPSSSAALLHLAERFHAALIDPRLELPPPRMGVEVDLAVVAGSLEAPLRRLGEAVTELPDAEAAERLSRGQAADALERLRSFAGKVSRYYQALSDLAGDEGLARRLRKSLAKVEPIRGADRGCKKRPGNPTPEQENARISGT